MKEKPYDDCFECKYRGTSMSYICDKGINRLTRRTRLCKSYKSKNTEEKWDGSRGFDGRAIFKWTNQPVSAAMDTGKSAHLTHWPKNTNTGVVQRARVRERQKTLYGRYHQPDDIPHPKREKIIWDFKTAAHVNEELQPDWKRKNQNWCDDRRDTIRFIHRSCIRIYYTKWGK